MRLMPHQLRGTTSNLLSELFIKSNYTKTMINYDQAKTYCAEDISKIENFEDAALDTTETWDIHHRREISENKSRLQMIEEGLIDGRPASELIFLTHSDHIRLHQTHRMTNELRHHLSEVMSGENNPQFGAVWSDERREKLRKTRKTKIANGEIKVDTSACHTEEANKKISDKAKERFKDKSNHPMFGRSHSEETKKKMSQANKGRIPWNKGKKIKLQKSGQ